MKAHLIFALSLITIVSLAGRTNAAIIIQFEETAGNVVAKTTGSFQVPSSPPDDSNSDTSFSASTNRFYYVNGNFDYWHSGSVFVSGVSVEPTSAEGDTLGYNYAGGQTLFLPSGLTPESTYTPDTTWTWSGQTLSGIGLNYLTTTPFQVYEFGGDTISFAAVPEPTTTALFIGGAAAAFAGLRRKKIVRTDSCS